MLDVVVEFALSRAVVIVHGYKREKEAVIVIPLQKAQIHWEVGSES